MHAEGSLETEAGSPAPLRQMLILGGTGDLSRRHLLPALTRLLVNGELSEEFSVFLTGLESMSPDACRDLVSRELSAHASHLPDEAREALANRVSYLRADVRDVTALRALAEAGPLLVYLATPSSAVPDALRAVCHAGIHRSGRIVLDKPFGLSRASAHALNLQLRESVDESAVYRIDHFLFHHAVQELARWRLEPDALAPLDGTRLAPAHVEIVWDETRALPSGALPYPAVLRDMIQSHLLQLAAVLTMDPPEALTHDGLSARRLDALRNLSTTRDASAVSRRAGPEMVATLALRSRKPRWETVPIVVRAAKGAGRSRRHIELRLGQPASGEPEAFVRLEVLAGTLVLGLTGSDASPVELAIAVDRESASTRLLRAALAGDDTFTLAPEEPEESWRIVEPALGVVETSDGAESLGA